jgi:O-antigen ligase
VLGLFFQDYFKIPVTLGIVGIGLCWVFSFAYKEKMKVLVRSPFALALIALYLLHLLSMIYTTDVAEGLNDLRLKITLFLLPLFMMTNQWIDKSKRIILLRIFALLMIVMASLDIGLSFVKFLDSWNFEVFYYNQLPHLLLSKAHYVAWYYSFALFVILFEVLNSKKYKIFWAFGFTLLLISMFLLASRIYLLAFFVVFFVAIFKLFKAGYYFFNSWKIVGILCLFLSLLFLFPKTQSRILETRHEIQRLLGAETQKQTNPRVYIWDFALSLVMESPLIGYGIGDAKAELNRSLRDCDAQFWNGEENIPIYEKDYNFHNQFIQTWAEVGVVGFLLLIFLMFGPFIRPDVHPLFLVFLGLTIFGFMTESMLERQAGILFFAFMYPLLSRFQKDALS